MNELIMVLCFVGIAYGVSMGLKSLDYDGEDHSYTHHDDIK